MQNFVISIIPSNLKRPRVERLFSNGMKIRDLQIGSSSSQRSVDF